MIRRRIFAMMVAAIGLAYLPTTLLAQQAQPTAFPGDNRLVTFVYDPNDSFTILTRPRSVTNLALSPGETMVALALGDTSQWMTEVVDGHIFVKPIRENIFTTGTLVTNQRVYQLALRASPENGKFYQRVSWETPSLIRHKRPITAPEQEKQEVEAPNEPQKNGPAVDISKVNFGYTIKGAASFRPTNVFDDGTFIYLRLPANLQDMPAVFVQTANGLELANYLTKGDHLIIQRLATKVLLRLGKVEVEVAAPNAPPPQKSFFNFFGE
ncbi:MAG: TrbG/VirB9 family P-type conjugative transfer protein [Betaproteobacteria bacterium]|jgi:P-type conjugative transfer protein VirB9|nr:TrbG/VirB9 family P-type conjugative transfer protein [Rhodocyclaceae bacterium]MCE2721957.1 TrbG/VirB9 family P-type conjugative transfer protein [Betaproteobacteria bacterium]